MPVTRNTPFICFRLAPLPAGWRKCLEAAVLAIGATAFVDLSAFDQDAAEKELRDVVLTHLPLSSGREVPVSSGAVAQ